MSLITNTRHLCLRQLHAHPYASTCSRYFIPPKKDTCVCQKKIRHGVIGCFIRTAIVLGEDEAKCWLVCLLQPANEVWGKVIFSQASVCPQKGDGVSVWEDLCPDRDHPPYGKERPVRILLECILVMS